MNLEQIIDEINKDLDDTQDNGDLIGWINRCVDDLSPIAKKEERMLTDIMAANEYELPENLFELALVLVNGDRYDTLEMSDTDNIGYKIWGNSLSLQNGPNTGTIDLYYYKRLDYLEYLEDIPGIEPSYHDLFILYTIAYTQFAEDEPERQMDAMTRYNNRKAEFERFIEKKANQFARQHRIQDMYGGW